MDQPGNKHGLMKITHPLVYTKCNARNLKKWACLFQLQSKKTMWSTGGGVHFVSSHHSTSDPLAIQGSVRDEWDDGWFRRNTIGKHEFKKCILLSNTKSNEKSRNFKINSISNTRVHHNHTWHLWLFCIQSYTGFPRRNHVENPIEPLNERVEDPCPENKTVYNLLVVLNSYFK